MRNPQFETAHCHGTRQTVTRSMIITLTEVRKATFHFRLRCTRVHLDPNFKKVLSSKNFCTTYLKVYTPKTTINRQKQTNKQKQKQNKKQIQKQIQSH